MRGSALLEDTLQNTSPELDVTLDGLSGGLPAGESDQDPPALARTISGEDVVAVKGSTVSLSDSLRPLSKWDRYEILGLLGRGGMGAVYRARDRRLGRVVALKFIRDDDENLTLRFVQEARAQSRIDHPFICKVHEVGEVEGKPYIAMQLIDGEPLDRACKDLRVFEKVKLIRDVATALHTAHEQSIIHRDIKPRKFTATETRGDLSASCRESFGQGRRDRLR